MTDRAALVAAARDSIAKGSKSFAMASHLFDRTTRERAWLLYAWCRRADDIADGQELGHGMHAVTDAPARLQRIREQTAMALAGRPTGDAAFDALGVVVGECAIPRSLPADVIDGFALDAADWRPRTEDDLHRYCYHVAGVVGVMMALVMGVSPDDHDTLDRACDLGLAFQFANIARDVSEDDAAGRCYLPIDWLVAEDIPPGEHMKPAFRPQLVRLVARLVEQAAAYEASARVGAARLAPRCRAAVLAAANIYGAIGREVAAKGAHAWDHRVTISKTAKFALVGRAFAESALTPPLTPREGLWVRPSNIL